MMKTCHTATYKGKTVFVILRNGERFEDRFVERTRSKIVIFEKRGRIPAGEIRSMSDRRLLQPVTRRK